MGFIFQAPMIVSWASEQLNIRLTEIKNRPMHKVGAYSLSIFHPPDKGTFANKISSIKRIGKKKYGTDTLTLFKQKEYSGHDIILETNIADFSDKNFGKNRDNFGR